MTWWTCKTIKVLSDCSSRTYILIEIGPSHCCHKQVSSSMDYNSRRLVIKLSEGGSVLVPWSRVIPFYVYRVTVKSCILQLSGEGWKLGLRLKRKTMFFTFFSCILWRSFPAPWDHFIPLLILLSYLIWGSKSVIRWWAGLIHLDYSKSVIPFTPSSHDWILFLTLAITRRKKVGMSTTTFTSTCSLCPESTPGYLTWAILQFLKVILRRIAYKPPFTLQTSWARFKQCFSVFVGSWPAFFQCLPCVATTIENEMQCALLLKMVWVGQSELIKINPFLTRGRRRSCNEHTNWKYVDPLPFLRHSSGGVTFSFHAVFEKASRFLLKCHRNYSEVQKRQTTVSNVAY